MFKVLMPTAVAMASIACGPDSSGPLERSGPTVNQALAVAEEVRAEGFTGTSLAEQRKAIDRTVQLAKSSNRVIPATTLVGYYKGNQVRGDSEAMGKRIVLKGTVESVTPDGDTVNVTLRGGLVCRLLSLGGARRPGLSQKARTSVFG